MYEQYEFLHGLPYHSEAESINLQLTQRSLDANPKIFEFIRELDSYGLLKFETKFAVLADDQSFNRTAAVMHFNEIGIGKQIVTFSNGLQTV